MNIKDYEWNKDCVEGLMKAIRSKQPVMLFGPPGIGKTSSVYAVGEALAMDVIEFNGSDERKKADLQDILSRVKMRSFRPVIYLIDECDGIQADVTLSKIVKEARQPLVLTCNEIWSVSDEVKNHVVQIKYLEPPLNQIVNVVRKEGLRRGIAPRFDRISQNSLDFRASLNSALNGGDKHEYLDMFTKVEGLIKRGTIPDDINDEYLIWLLDNASKFYWGRKLYEFIQLLCEVSRLPDTQTSKWAAVADFTCQINGRVSYPNYLTRMKALSNQRQPRSKSKRRAS